MQIDAHRERTVTPRTARALTSKSARNTAETSKAASYRWLLAQTKVSRGFRNEAVIAETSIGLLWTYGPNQASHVALVSLCQKMVDAERTPFSGPHTQFLVCLCQKSADPPKWHCLVDGARVPEKSLPGISRHQKDAAFWAVHALPGNL